MRIRNVKNMSCTSNRLFVLVCLIESHTEWRDWVFSVGMRSLKVAKYSHWIRTRNKIVNCQTNESSHKIYRTVASWTKDRRPYVCIAMVCIARMPMACIVRVVSTTCPDRSPPPESLESYSPKNSVIHIWYVTYSINNQWWRFDDWYDLRWKLSRGKFRS